MTLDALLDLSHGDLAPLYEAARAPSIEEVTGDLRGRMLAVPVFPQWATKWPRAWARTSTFPWRGKSFRAVGEEAGEGKNRVFSDRIRLYRFTTKIGPSHHDREPAFLLDYDHPENPWFIRRIEDEIREIAPGLYLGQAYVRTGSGARFVLWFGLTSR